MVKSFEFNYGNEKISCEINEDDIIYNVEPKDIKIIENIEEEILKVLNNPIGTISLREILQPGEKICIIVSDITRGYVKTSTFLIHIVNYINDLGIPDNDIFIVIALGTHRKAPEEEKKILVGDEVYSRIKVYNHEAIDKKELVYLGETSRKTPLFLNKRVYEADRIILTGGIKLHPLAGFGGGAKGILPGVMGEETIQYNHKLNLLKADKVSNLDPDVLNYGLNKIEDNDVRQDMIEACDKLGVDFIFNVVPDSDGNFIKFVAGHYLKAWVEGCEVYRKTYRARIKEKCDIMITSAGGEKYDINLYQSIKAAANNLLATEKDGVIILITYLKEGLGGEVFKKALEIDDLQTIDKMRREKYVHAVNLAYTTLYTAKHRTVILISSLDDEVVKKLHMIPCHDLNEAIKLAYKITNKEHPKITLLPHGINALLEFE